MFLLNKTAFRISIAAVGFLSAIFAPPWVPLVAIAILALRFRSWEVPVIGLMMDFVWLPGSFIFPLPLFTIASIILVWGLEPLRNEFLL